MEIHFAARQGDLDGVLAELKCGVDVDARLVEENGQTALMDAAQSPRAAVSMLELLVSHGANVNAVSTKLQVTPLIQAIRSNQIEKVRYLLAAKANPRFKNSSGYTALIHGQPPALAITELLLQAGTDVNGVTVHNESALSVASRIADWPTVKLLLDYAANPAPLEWTPLMRAIALDSADRIISTLKEDHNLSARDRWLRTPWLISLATGDVAKAKLLKAAGASLTDSGHCGTICLQYAVMGRNAELLRWLLHLGIDVDIRDDFGDTALMTAVANSDMPCLEILLESGASICPISDDQAINRAVNSEIIKRLVKAGADINFISAEGSFPLEQASSAGDINLVKTLLSLGASVHNTSTGFTALHAAVEANQLEIIELLLAVSANPNAQDVDGHDTLWYVRSKKAEQMLQNAKRSN
jgi:ankyrin repeat protein